MRRVAFGRNCATATFIAISLSCPPRRTTSPAVSTRPSPYPSTPITRPPRQCRHVAVSIPPTPTTTGRTAAIRDGSTSQAGLRGIGLQRGCRKTRPTSPRTRSRQRPDWPTVAPSRRRPSSPWQQQIPEGTQPIQRLPQTGRISWAMPATTVLLQRPCRRRCNFTGCTTLAAASSWHRPSLPRVGSSPPQLTTAMRKTAPSSLVMRSQVSNSGVTQPEIP